MTQRVQVPHESQNLLGTWTLGVRVLWFPLKPPQNKGTLKKTHPVEGLLKHVFTAGELLRFHCFTTKRRYTCTICAGQVLETSLLTKTKKQTAIIYM